MGAEPAPQDTGNTNGAGTRSKRNYRKITLIAAVVAVVVYAIPYYYTSSPSACASCHRMKPYYDSWKTSSHVTATSNCLACHVRQGTLNIVAYRLLFYWEIFAEVTGIDGKPIGVMIPGVESCRRSGCHSLNRTVSTSAELRISHREHVVKAHISCIKCHPGAAHKGVGKRFLVPPRKLCVGCHKDKMRDCGYCHIEPVARLPAGVH